MRISLRVLISGIIAVFASLNLLRVATFMAFGLHPSSRVPPILPLILAGLVAALAAWGVFTAIGLFWHKRWARISIQVFGVALALLSLLAGFGALTGLRYLIAANPGPVAIRSALAQVVIYPAQIVIAIWWLVLFNTRGAKEEFGAARAGPTLQTICP